MQRGILCLCLFIWCAAVPVWAQDSAIHYFQRGKERAAKDNFAGAIEDFSAAIAFNPDFAAVYYNRGNAYVAKGELDKAMADFDKAIELDPKLVEAYFNRGCLKYQRARHD